MTSSGSKPRPGRGCSRTSTETRTWPSSSRWSASSSVSGYYPFCPHRLGRGDELGADAHEWLLVAPDERDRRIDDPSQLVWRVDRRERDLGVANCRSRLGASTRRTARGRCRGCRVARRARRARRSRLRARGSRVRGLRVGVCSGAPCGWAVSLQRQVDDGRRSAGSRTPADLVADGGTRACGAGLLVGAFRGPGRPGTATQSLDEGRCSLSLDAPSQAPARRCHLQVVNHELTTVDSRSISLGAAGVPRGADVLRDAQKMADSVGYLCWGPTIYTGYGQALAEGGLPLVYVAYLVMSPASTIDDEGPGKAALLAIDFHSPGREGPYLLAGWVAYTSPTNIGPFAINEGLRLRGKSRFFQSVPAPEGVYVQRLAGSPKVFAGIEEFRPAASSRDGSRRARSRRHRENGATLRAGTSPADRASPPPPPRAHRRRRRQTWTLRASLRAR